MTKTVKIYIDEWIIVDNKKYLAKKPIKGGNPLNENNVDLGWPYFEGEFAHQPFYNISVNSIKQKSPIFSERIGGLIGGHFLKISGKNLRNGQQ